MPTVEALRTLARDKGVDLRGISLKKDIEAALSHAGVEFERESTPPPPPDAAEVGTFHQFEVRPLKPPDPENPYLPTDWGRFRVTYRVLAGNDGTERIEEVNAVPSNETEPRPYRGSPLGIASLMGTLSEQGLSLPPTG